MDSKEQNFLKISDKLNSIKDLDRLLESILETARKFTNADAGSIMTVSEGDTLTLQYIQNDTLSREGLFKNKNVLSHQSIDINCNSIAGCAAEKKETLLIEDAYSIAENKPYTFNPDFDKKSSYRTESILALPLLTNRHYLKGVIEIINKKDDMGKSIPFTGNDLLYVKHFSNIAAGAIERASMTREIILRMIKMAELRDPKETGPHVNRVGAYSVAIYRDWAKKKNIPVKKAEKFTDNLRIAAMLHDLGKVGISDTILKKPARLTEEERRVMMYHPIIGAKLFKNKTSNFDQMSAQIALNHHEKWNGEGYPGKIDNIYSDNVKLGEGKKGEEIPLAGRIVAIADVYDALISKRTYKDGWPEEKVLKLIKEEAGQHFDPDLVDCFLNVQESVKAIKEKFKD